MEIKTGTNKGTWDKIGYEEEKVETREEWIRHHFMKLTYGRDKRWDKASEIVADYVKDHITMYTTKSDTKTETWVYEDGIYVPEGRSIIKKLMRELLKEMYSLFIFNRVMEKIEPDTYIDPDVFFSTNYKWEIPVLNGILNLQTLEVSPFTPEKIFFSKINAEYVEGEICPAIDKFLSEVLAKPEDRDVFYEMVGFCLLKEYTYEKAFMLVGDGLNGKGKSIELLKRLIGVKNCSALPLTSLVPNSFDIAHLYNKMANIAGDIGPTGLKDTGVFKELTARDLVTGNRKYLHPIEFENFAKFIFACNELPMVYDHSLGFWNRWVLIEYPYTFLTKEEIEVSSDKEGLKLRDDNIIEKIITPKEMSGFLNMAILGLHRLIQNKRFSTTLGTKEIKQKWIRKSNSFMAFCLDFVESDYDGHIVKKDLRRKYADYCKEHGLKTKSDIVIKRTLQESLGASEERIQIGGVGSYTSVWSGVRFKQKKEENES